MAKKAKKQRSRAAAKKDSGRSRVKPSETMAVIGELQFRSLVRSIKSFEKDRNEAAGNIGSKVRNAVEKHHLDKKAFSLYSMLERMSDNKLATTLAHFDHYREIGGLDERAAKQSEMFERSELREEQERQPEPEEQEEVEERTEAAPADANVRHVRKGSFARRVREQQPDFDSTPQEAAE